MHQKQIDKLLDRFFSSRSLYQRFTNFCLQQVNTYVEERGFWIETVQSRTKEMDSLKRKLTTGDVSVKRLKDIRDLSGIRIVFFLDSEIRKFFDSLFDHHKIGRLIISQSDEHYREPGFFGVYLTLQLPSDDKGSDVQEFEKLTCELQVSNVFQRAWAEVYHRTIYRHREDLSEFAKAELETIEVRYKEVISGSLKDASDAIHYLNEAASQLSKGAKIIRQESFSGLTTLTDFNSSCSTLRDLTEFLDAYGHKVPATWKPFEHLWDLVVRSRSFVYQPAKVGPLTFRGRTREDLVHNTLAAARQLAYQMPYDFIHFCKQIWSEEKGIGETAAQTLKEIGRHDLAVIRYTGYQYHNLLVDECRQMVEENGKVYSPLVLPSIEAVLGFKPEGTEQTGPRTYSFPIGIIPGSEALSLVRRKAQDLLLEVASRSDDDQLRIHALRIVLGSLHLPYSPQACPTTLSQMILRESQAVLDRLQKNTAPLSFPEVFTIKDELQKLEYYYNKEGLPTAYLTEYLEKLLQPFTKSFEFALVDTKSGCVDIDRLDQALELSKEKARLLARSIDQNDYESWCKRICEIAGYYPLIDRHYFVGLDVLLEEIVNSKYELARMLIERHLLELKVFASSVVAWSLSTDNRDTLLPILEQYVMCGRGISKIAWGIAFAKVVPEPLIRTIVSEATRQNDSQSLLTVVQGLSRMQSFSSTTVSMLLEVIEALVNIGNFRWTQSIYAGDRPIFAELCKTHPERVLKCLLAVPRIDYDEEQLLIHIAREHPVSVFAFFFDRVALSRSRKSDDHFAYSALPFDLSQLSEVLQRTSQSVLANFLDTVKFVPEDQRWIATELLSRIFSLNVPVLKSFLSSLIDSEDKADIDLALSILAKFGSSITTHEFYQAIIAKQQKNKQLWKDITFRLLHSSSSRGDDGILLQLQAFSQATSIWDDSNPKIKEFKKFFADKAKVEIERERDSVRRERAKEQLKYDDYVKRREKVRENKS